MSIADWRERMDTSRADWIEDCMKWRGKVLKGEKAHWCYEWDGLPIDETTPEFESCLCFEPPREAERGRDDK